MASNHGAIPKRKLSRYGLKRIGVNTVYRPKSFDSGLTLVQEFQKGDSMPYLCTYDNRRIGEHDCGHYHHGDQTLVRPCCVEDCKHWAETCLRVAMTDAHPSYRLYIAAWNELTDAEMSLVPDVRYMGADRGLVALTEEQRETNRMRQRVRDEIAARGYVTVEWNDYDMPVRAELPDGTVDTWEYDEQGRECVFTRE